MKTIKKIIHITVFILVIGSFLQCATSMKLEKESPVKFIEAYTKSWMAGVKGGGSGNNIFIKTKPSNIVLDTVYFRGKISKLEVKPQDSTLFMGRFLFTSNTRKDLLISQTDKKESEMIDFPFTLKDNECVVSYMYKEKRNYYKIGNIIERQTDALPMSVPPNKN